MSTVAERPTAQTQLTETPPDSLSEMTFEEFLAWHNEDILAEWVNGRVEFRISVDLWNNELGWFIATLIRLWIQAKKLGGRVFVDPSMMLLTPSATRPVRKGAAREPDVMYVSAENIGRAEKNLVNGPADIVVEIVSPDSRRDRHVKFFEYQNAGVREYWIYDPELNEAEFYQLNETGKYQRAELENDAIYHSAVLPGFTLDVTWLAQQPSPDITDIQKAWGLI